MAVLLDVSALRGVDAGAGTVAMQSQALRCRCATTGWVGSDKEIAGSSDGAEVSSDGTAQSRLGGGEGGWRGGPGGQYCGQQLGLFDDHLRLTRLRERAGEHQLMIVDGLAEAGQTGHQDRTLAESQTGPDNSGTGMTDDNPCAGQALLQCVAW